MKNKLNRLTLFVLMLFAIVVSNTIAATQFIFNPDSSTGNFNIVPNGSFETGNTAGWTPIVNPNRGAFTASQASAFLGSWSASSNPSFDFTGIGFDIRSGNIIVQPGQTYVLSAFLNTANMSGSSLYVDLSDVSFEPNVGNFDPDRFYTPWFFAWDQFTVPQNVSSINVRLVRDGFAGTAKSGEFGFIDGVAITPLSQFSPPVAIPEPSAYLSGVLGAFLSVAYALRRRLLKVTRQPQ